MGGMATKICILVVVVYKRADRMVSGGGGTQQPHLRALDINNTPLTYTPQ